MYPGFTLTKEELIELTRKFSESYNVSSDKEGHKPYYNLILRLGKYNEFKQWTRVCQIELCWNHAFDPPVRNWLSIDPKISFHLNPDETKLVLSYFIDRKMKFALTSLNELESLL